MSDGVEKARPRLLLPFGAYRRDRLRTNRDTPFSPHDGIWLVMASFLDNLGLVAEDTRDEVLLNHERALADALGAEVVELPAEHPFHWASRLRVALTSTPSEADHDAVVRTVQRMAAEMAAVGAVDLGLITLQAAQRAFPRTSPETDVRVLLQRARLSVALGNTADARQLLTSARSKAKAAGLGALMEECERERRHLPRRRRSSSSEPEPPPAAARKAKPKRR